MQTYKFHQGETDGVILDLKYNARDIPQRKTKKKAIEEYFEHKTRMLNNSQRAIIRRRWVTMENLMSAEGRKNQIAASIMIDFDIKPRLNNNRGTAILVASSIYDACHYFRIFKTKIFGKYCGIITSYHPNPSSISSEPLDSEARYKFDTYKRFSYRVQGSKKKLIKLLKDLKKKGKKVISYGATYKSATVFNYCNINSSLIDFVIDTTKNKQGKYTPGKHLLIKHRYFFSVFKIF